jgi:hypothetical protein
MNIWIIGTLILSLASPIFYTRSMLAGKAKPHRVTRLIVWLAAVAGVLGIIFAGIFLARATYLLIMSLIYGVGGASRLDKWCFVIGILALVLYVVTGNGLLAISFGIIADLIAYIPTFVKTWKDPKSEDPTFFTIEAVASLFAVIAIWELRADILFPIYFVLCSLAVIFLIYRKQIVRRFKRASVTADLPE